MSKQVWHDNDDVYILAKYSLKGRQTTDEQAKITFTEFLQKIRLKINLCLTTNILKFTQREQKFLKQKFLKNFKHRKNKNYNQIQRVLTKDIKNKFMLNH